jgi:glutamyl-tRNA synthetase
MNDLPIRTRFAPSPTGFLHIGGLRTALYSYAFAKSQKGSFVLRIEDTDRNRFIPGSTEKIYEILKTFGLLWDEGPLVGGPHSPYIQSERVASGIYRKCAEKLVADGHAYYCFHPAETREQIETSHQRKEIKLRDTCRNLSSSEVESRIKSGEKPAIRLRLPDHEQVTYHDFVLNKDITWTTNDIDEVMLLKSDGFPTYHLGVVVDDAAMQISHIIRGRDWLPSTPVHLLLFKYLSYPLPQIGHLTDILDPAGGKLSKRKHNVSVEQFLAEGYLPEAILNFIMLVGWAPSDNREMFTLSEFVDHFPKGKLQTANPVFNDKKLNWFNGQYIRLKTEDELADLLKPFAPKEFTDDLIRKTVPLVKERIAKLSDYTSLVEFLTEEIKVDIKLLIEKGGGDAKLIKKQLNLALEILTKTDWEAEKLEESFRKIVTENNWNLGQYFMTLRISITGKTVTPPLFESVILLGKDKTLDRLNQAVKLLV